MTILSGDVKLLKSANMADVDEGGGAPTNNVIADGVSNAIFPDISELDRAGGRVNLRKTFIGVQTDNTDTYFGGNVIVAEPPEDPRVSVTLFSTEDTFDTRIEAKSRIESYLNRGAEWSGYLFENHIIGQRVIQLFHRVTDTLPTVGQTLVIVENENASNEKLQYVRATSVTSQARNFTYAGGSGPVDYAALVVTVEISDALRYDFTGSPSSRLFTRASTGSRIRDTVVADAGTYVGVVPLTATADIGDFTVSGESVFTQLVPSAQTETPISDTKMNGVSAALVGAGSPITESYSLAFTTTQSMYVGSPILPNTLSISRSGVTLTDSGGSLVSAGSIVGTVDYDNGILTLSSNVFGTSSGAHSVTFTPASTPELITRQSGIVVTVASRSLSYAFTMDNPPTPGSLYVSYLAQGRWYVLRDNKSGTISGNDSSFGAGTVNYTTGSVVLTLGALPDVGSRIIVHSASSVNTIGASNTTLLNGGKAFAYLNTSGLSSEEQGSKTITPNMLVINWTSNSVAKQAVDDGAGNLTGDASGIVDYNTGVIRISPNNLPVPDTIFSLDLNGAAAQSYMVTPSTLFLGQPNITPGTVSLPLDFQYTFAWAASGRYKAGSASFFKRIVVYDRQGALYIADPSRPGAPEIAIGTVTYASGYFSLLSSISITSSNNLFAPTIKSDSGWSDWTYYTSSEISFNQYGGSKSVTVNPVASIAPRLASFATVTPAADLVQVTVNQYIVAAQPVENYKLRNAGFTLGGSKYRQTPNDSLIYNFSPTTGTGSPAGSVSSSTCKFTLSLWPTDASPTLSNWTGTLAPPTEGVEAPFTSYFALFRTAAAPIRPGSFSVLGTMYDGTTFNVTAGEDGKISGVRVKGVIDYSSGVVELHFVNPSGSADFNADLSYLGIPGLSVIPTDLVQLNTVRYNAVSYTYLPLDADLLGIDPVRLPSDGRVPIFRPGGFAVVGHTGEITATVSNGQTIDCARARLSRVRVIGNDGAVINTGYTTDLEAGTVSFVNVTGYSQPVTIQHRIEDMAVVSATSISGEITFTRALTHDYPLGSYVSSALIAGDLFSRVSVLFDQSTWNGSWLDAVSGSSATATFNSTQYPIAVTNKGAITERWIVQFTNSTSFNVIGEHVGQIATGSTASNCAPLNPNTGVPYFTIPAAGWGAGWATGNALRFNTIGAEFPVWVVRTIQQGPETVPNDSFTLLIRGDVDTVA